MEFLTWITIGAIAGWLAGQVMKRGGYGVPFDILLGALCALVGGWIFQILEIWPGRGTIGFLIVTFMGTTILVGATRLVKIAHRRFLERME
jgi:uncharacterized membrane protein YeaQ/YmgE (transglycosylase-associated protein family)